MDGKKKNDYVRIRTIYKCTTMCFFIFLYLCSVIDAQVMVAPTIQMHPPEEVAYRSGNEVILPCRANPDSKSEYTWKKDGEPLALSGRRIELYQPSSYGDLIIRRPTKEDEGRYQCFAKNQQGTAVSTRALLKETFFTPFPTQDPITKRPEIGESLNLSCTPPDSYPKDTPYWGISRPGDSKHRSLATSDRILIDYSGQLHFANVIESDAIDEQEYICVLPNVVLNAHAHGNNHRIMPHPAPGGPQHRKPHLLWASRKLDVAVKGQTKKIKCIFGGYPTPRVSWKPVGRPLNNRMVHTSEGHGTELEIRNVDETDAGEYECSAINAASPSPVSHIIKLVVHSKPFWNQNQPPTDVQVMEEGDASFTCLAYGTPKPTITWGVNGVGLEKLPPDPRRTLDRDTLRYRNVTKEDTQVIQCVAENEHGSILANAHLYVISAPPSFTTAPSDSIVVEGNRVRLECRAYGAPQPVIRWMRGEPSYPVSTGWGSHYILHESGDLEIERTMLNDEDDYFCVAQNKHNTSQAKAKLSVRQPTVIGQSPANVAANRSDDVTLRCDVTTDPKEYKNLKVEWRRDGRIVDFSKETHMIMDSETHSLKITRSMVKDTAKYTCHATNGLDSAESSPTQLTIKDRPEPPSDLKIVTCTSHSAEISFLPGSDNNDPITSYIVYYSVDDEPQLLKALNITRTQWGQGRINAEVTVQPWRSYKFQVTAQNGLGTSELSANVPDRCNTPASAPAMNPRNVCSKLRGTGLLVITWDPVPKEEHYGPDYCYVVEYRLYPSGKEYNTIEITDPNKSEQVFHDRPVFTRYEISVYAKNKIGRSPYKSMERKIVYSSEGKPLQAPKNFELKRIHSGTHATFEWDAVDTSFDKIRGFFRGYRIKFWKSKDPNNVRTEDIILDNSTINLCPDIKVPLPPESRFRRQLHQGARVQGETHKLWPYSKVLVAVTVLNSAHDGPNSKIIEIDTPEGPPEAVKDLIVTEVGSSHLAVAWSLPAAANGIIKSFVLEYQVAPPEVGALRKDYINDPNIMSRKILELQAETKYRVTLYAVTDAGPGQSIYIDEITLSDSQPDKPRISLVEAGVDSANVSFDPTDRPPKQNPGSHFYVEYAKEGIGNNWEKTKLDPHNPENWVQVQDLEPGVYFFRVVAVNGRDGHTRETRSDAMRIEIGERRDYAVDKPIEEGLVQHAGASAGWFIVLMCIIILLLIILLIICCIKRSKGDMYPVYEKEKMLGRDPFAPDDAPFGEYNSSGRPDRSRSQGSLDSDDKPIESDTDSLGEYEDQDASKFNEDGSFIGLYGTKGRPRPEPTAPSMNTFV